MDNTLQEQRYDTIKRLRTAEGDLAYSLTIFGDYIAKREGYKEHQDLDAIYYYLVQKFSWPIAQVRSMSYEDIRFVLAEEMHGWTLPDEAKKAFK